ncbi:neural proliferation differentiation and control protein 1 [Ahaetulla prasina]|uniref:neural proliferation differentiation and control protein 1 n=1 Tax=Ahaetulla prasina TaxID=499056 RepID=UPI00264701DD|nr:neural proliferation differentiation and control protein 1 [Ahaetulla prasina]
MSAAACRRPCPLPPTPLPPVLLLLLPLLLLPPPGAWGLLATPGELCPRHLDCTLQRRKECPLGSHACGPCLPQFVEDREGRCVARTAEPKGRSSLVPELEEEIDLVSDVLSKQGRGPLPHGQEESPASSGPHSRKGASKAESSQSGRQRWPGTSSQPTTESPVESTHISSNDALVLGLIVVCTAAGVAALVVATICWCRLQKEIQLAQKADYPANKLPQLPSYDKLSPGDRKLAQSAQMYHYQHQKQQMLSMEKHKEEAKAPESVSSDEENEDGDFTVYECPGLAPVGVSLGGERVRETGRGIKGRVLAEWRQRWPGTSSQPTTESPVESTHISSNDALVLGLIVVCTAAGVAALVVATICWCRLQKEIQLAQKADYPANKLPQLPSYDKLSPGDRKLAQSAQMYHYQHQKQQMLSMEKHKEEAKAPESVSSDEENEDGDFTVYECPGLAPTGEMEVKNPLFDDSTLPPKLHP